MNGVLAVRTIVGDLFSCVGFFTRIPVFGPMERRLADAIWAAPLVGIVVGLAGALAFAVSAALGLPPAISAILAIATTMLITGCLHEDGLSDVADGFGGGVTRQRKLEIMKDSRIGAYGVIALVVTVLLRWQALIAIADTGSVLLALLASHAASRSIIPAFMMLVPPARDTGLSATAGAIRAGAARTALLAGAASLLLLGIGPAIVAAIVLTIWFIALKWLTERQIGGQTGDVLGCLQQGAEIAVLLVALSLDH
ncbi:adenosylcobinamide-GDP ribazoletransferase [Arvimicrobium flavum]|uniref:adenosylcobinamide-GDP ribazoletransferase n=1 Tax=Arvimicrobium flavum TaxID=3393320 RepID=UPI00237AB1F5|nr:adenosylcobinamide-GDP ribazoletransferase [Mesorhizobium shangrilense]